MRKKALEHKPKLPPVSSDQLESIWDSFSVTTLWFHALYYTTVMAHQSLCKYNKYFQQGCQRWGLWMRMGCQWILSRPCNHKEGIELHLSIKSWLLLFCFLIIWGFLLLITALWQWIKPLYRKKIQRKTQNLHCVWVTTLLAVNRNAIFWTMRPKSCGKFLGSVAMQTIKMWLSGNTEGLSPH